MGIPSGAATQAFGVVDRINLIQARYSLGSSDVRARTQSRKRIAAGGC